MWFGFETQLQSSDLSSIVCIDRVEHVRMGNAVNKEGLDGFIGFGSTERAQMFYLLLIYPI